MTERERALFEEEYRLLMQSCHNLGSVVSAMPDDAYREHERLVKTTELAMRRTLAALRTYLDKEDA